MNQWPTTPAAMVLIVALLAAMLAFAPSNAALAPHPLDAAFESDEPAKAICGSDLFKQAVSEATKAKRQAEESKKTGRPTPEQAARVRFLEVMREGK